MCPERVEYDSVAANYDNRYERYDWRETEQVLREFVRGAGALRALEVGCGTGHWLRAIADVVAEPIGIEPSWGMLRQAARRAGRVHVIRGSAENLPLGSAIVDRVFCVNALHHFHDQDAFVGECRRVLRPGGGFLSIGLDPHAGLDRWWIYDYFPGVLPADRERYRSAGHLRQKLAACGFQRLKTKVAHHIVAEMFFEQAERTGLLDRNSASQFLVIGDAEFQEGIERLRAERPVLRADLRMFATSGWLQE